MQIDAFGNSYVQGGKFYLGCPVWSCAAWAGHFLTDDAKQRDFLTQYSTVFNTVEGNSTFYALPKLDIVRRWAEETPTGFRFALKFPREISHDKQLLRAERETNQFRELLGVLRDADRLGPSFLQLSPTFDKTQFAALESYLRDFVKADLPLAVEVRHADYFDSGPVESALDELLSELQIDRVIFDSRPLFSAAPSDPSEVESQRRKPRSLLRHTVTGPHPFLRLVGRNDLRATLPWLEEWAPIIAQWLREGRSPFIFAHTPNDFFAPAMARALHQELLKHCPELPALPAWPHEKRLAIRAKQKTLF
ncbi:MAG: hypothetical protein JWM11_5176 [Planctomycetaceae bacterium]|nr:hypothetical protein [Planctomycetaceae bacterium]